jgi:large subunit ribosomal protein L18
MSMKSLTKKDRLRKARARRVRKRIRGSAECPRMCVNKSNSNLFVQIIDDESGKTLCSASTISRELRDSEAKRCNKTSARALGGHIGKVAKDLKLERVVFDRGSSKYHGVLAEVAEGARESGLRF